MRDAQWRGAVEQWRDRLPGQPFIGDTVGFGGHAKALQRLQRQTHQLAGEAVSRVALVAVDVNTRKALALEHIAITAPSRSSAARAWWIEGGPLGPPPWPSYRMR
jgi:hypothetical protein